MLGGTVLDEYTREAPTGETLKSLHKALRLMESLAEAERGLGLVELSRKLGMNKTVVYRILATLLQCGYVVRDESGRYSLSLKAFELGAAVVSRIGLREAAIGPMSDLARQCGETINLAVLDGSEAVYIDRVECAEPLRAVLRVGKRVPLHCTALGKVLLAYQPPDERERIVTDLTLERFTPRTITDRDRLRLELARVREAGFSLDDEEHIPGVRCLGAPVFGQHGEVVAALSIAGPSVRLSREGIAGFANALKAAALTASRGLGYIPRPGLPDARGFPNSER